MAIKDTIKKLIRSFGYEVRKYTPDRSDEARLGRFLQYHNINLVFDVGGNVGQYATSLRRMGYQGRIVSFEPLERAHALLVSSSRNDDLWTIAPRAAIGDRDGQISINVAKNSVSSSVLPMLDTHKNHAPDSVYFSVETVPIYKLDTIAPDYLGQEDASVYLKIDVQGYESQVLAGASRILPRIKGIQLELSLVPLYEGERLFQEMLILLDKLGFELHAVIPGFTEMQSGRLLQMDGIFFRG